MKLTSGKTRGRTRDWTEPWEDLAAVGWFAGLPRDVLRAAGQHADWLEVAAGTRLQPEGLRVRWLWVPVGGPLELRRNGEPVGRVEVGEAFGEAEVLLGTASTVDVVAPAPTAVLSFPARAFHGLLDEAAFASAVARRQAHAHFTGPALPRLRLVPA
jgi:CRP-like cAMP-binding protein